ncbi:MAG: hypothetical protein WBH52_27275 [Pseudomonas aeruginosa]|uniref:hypothetical protein n=1 Tax=Bordetella hinzii TaxID=103855 RepID=UPI0012D30E62|nr:hypothetical protein [Bordetella hinzii]
MGEERTTLKGMINNEQVPFTSFIDFAIPQRWFWSIWRLLMLGNMFRGGAMGNSLAVLINLIIGIMLGLLFYVPIYLYYFYLCFFLASVYRLVTGKGGKSGMKMSAVFVIGYILLFRYVYVPWLLPLHFAYVDWGDVMRYVKLY